MKRASLLLIVLLLSSFLALPAVKAAENPGPWVKTYGGSKDDWANAVALAPNGDIIVAGRTKSFGAGDYDAFVARLSPDGQVKWFKTYGGSDYDWANAVALAPNGDIIVAGVTNSTGAGGDDVWVLLLDSQGNVIWQKTYGGSGNDGATAVAVAPNGDIIVAGWTDSFGAGNGDVWVLRLDSDGNVKWQKTYGGKHDDKAYAVALAPNGDIIVAGVTYSFVTGPFYIPDVWVLRLDSNGNVIWQKTYGVGEADAVAVERNDIIVAGETWSFGAGNGDVWVLKLDSNGNVIWQKTYGGEFIDEADAVALDGNDIIVAGWTKSFGAGGRDVWVLKLDGNGNVIWGKAYGGSDYDGATAVAVAPNGDIIVAGWTDSFGAGNGDVWVLRLPPDGNLLGCDFCSNSNAQVENTDATVTTPNVQVENSDATVQNSHATVETVNQTVKTQYSLKELVNSEIQRAQSAISEYKSQGVVLTPAEELLNKAQQTFKSEDYTNAYNYAEQALQKAEEIKEQYDKARATFDNAEDIFSYIQSNDIVVPSDVKELFRRAQDAFNSGDYLTAQNLSAQFIEKAEPIKEKYDKAKPEVEKAQSTISSYKSQGVILSDEVFALLNKAQEAFKSGDYTNAYGYASQALQKAEEIKEQHDKASSELSQANEKLSTYKSQGVVLTPAEGLLNKAQEAFKSGDYTTAYKYAEEALHKAEEIKEQYEQAKEAIIRAEGFLSPIGDAKAAFERGDYVTAYRLAVEAAQKRDLYQKLFALGVILAAAVVSGSAYRVHRKRKLEREKRRRVERFNALLSEAEGGPIGRRMRLLLEAYNLVKNFEPSLAEKAKSLLESTREEARSRLGSLLADFSSAIESLDVETAEEKLREAEDYALVLGESIDSERKKLSELKDELRALERAEEALKSGNLTGAAEPVGKLVKSSFEGIRKRAERLLQAINGELDGLIARGDSELSKGNFRGAVETYRKALAIARHVGRKEEVQEKLRKAEEAVEKAELEGQVEEILEEARRHAEMGEYAEAVALYEEALAVARQDEDLAARVRKGMGSLERKLYSILSSGDSLLSERRFDEAIRTYESAIPLAEALGKAELVRDRIERAKALKDRESQMARLNELLSKADELIDRRNYGEAVNVLNEALGIARSLDLEGKVMERLDSLRTRLDNLLSKGDSAFENGDYTGALKLYGEALSIAEALGEGTSKVEDRIKKVEERRKLELLKESVRIDVPSEMAHKAETEVSIIVTNRFSDELSLTVDLSDNARYFELDEERIEFPPIEPGATIGEDVTVKPRFLGDFRFTVKVSSSVGSFERSFPVKVVKTLRATPAGTPTPFTRTPILNPVEALQELYSDFQYIGEGGFARVYKAKRKDGKTVALKIPKTLDPAVGRAFVREITNWLHLKHPNIVELYDVNVLPVPYLEMEYCESSLARLQKPMPVDEASLIVFNIAEGLKYAHSKKIVHRDLKPSNVLLKSGLPKISDWGLSKVLEESMSATTTASFTPFYAAPEQIDRKFGHTDERTDIWQLGVIFYELVTGRLPFEGSLSQVMMGILRDEPVPPSQLNPKAKEVEPIIMKMLAKRKEERYQSVEELQRDLAKILNMTYSESLRESKTLGDARRAVYYLTELLLINLKTNNPGEAYKYASDLVFYAKGELRKEVQKLAEQVKFRLEENLEIPPELIEKAEIIVHKIRLDRDKV